MKHADHDAHCGHACLSGESARDSASDPVCGMTVDPAMTAHHARHEGHDYHFCSAGCRTKFVADPTKYLSGRLRPQPEATPGAIWTCPMHPDEAAPKMTGQFLTLM